MQKSNIHRLLTPTQPLSRQQSSLRTLEPDGYSQRLVPFPPTHGYHPQTIWVPDYHPPSGGPRAVPMRMQRLTMNRTDTRPMPIPSMQLTSDRPYSVPNYHSSRKSGGYDGGFTRPPRPASTSEIDDIDKLVPRRELSFLNRDAVKRAEDKSSISRKINPDGLKSRLGISKTTLRVAKRGSQIPASDGNIRNDDYSDLNLTSRGNSSDLTRKQKRVNDDDIDEPNISKKIKINVIRSQSQTPIANEITNQTYPNTRLRATQLAKNTSRKDATAQKQINQNIEVDDEETQSSDSEDDTAETVLISKTLGQTGAIRAGKQNSDDIMTGVSPIEIFRDLGDFDKTQTTINIEETNSSSDLFGSSSAICQEPIITSQRRRYANAPSQSDLSSELPPRLGQVKPESKASEHYQSTATSGNTSGAQDPGEGKANEEALDARLSRIEKAIRVQEEEGVDEFIKAKLSTGDPSILRTLTNEILLAMVVPNDELLEQVIKLM